MSVMKRGNTYYLRIRPFQELVNVRTPATSKAEAEKLEMSILKALRAGDYRLLTSKAREVCVRMFQNQGWGLPSVLAPDEPIMEEMTLWRGIEIFLNYPEIRECDEKKRYINCFAHLVEHFGKHFPLKNMWVPEIKEYMVLRSGEQASSSQINREKGTLSKMFQVLIEMRLLEVNPCRLIKNLSQKSEERQVYLSLADVTRIADACPEWFRSIIWTSYYTGMRRGEIIGMTKRNLKLTKRMIYLRPDETKEHHWKRVPIHHDLVPILEASLQVSTAGDGVFSVTVGRGVRPINLEAAKNPWRRACRILKLEEPWPRFHDLRHTWKTNARRSRMDPEIRESILGHWFKEKSVMERYGIINEVELLQAIDSMTFDHGETEIWARVRPKKRDQKVTKITMKGGRTRKEESGFSDDPFLNRIKKTSSQKSRRKTLNSGEASWSKRIRTI